MKKWIVFIAAACSFLICGVAIGESLNGSFNGNPIVIVKNDGKVISDEVPAQVIDGKTMVPLTMLRQFGFDVNWDQSTYSVEVKPAPLAASKDDSSPKKLTAKDIAQLINRVGVITTYDQNWNAIAQGSGFLIGSTGYTITNSHVMNNAARWKFEIDGKTYLNSWYVFNDTASDLFGFMADVDINNGNYNTHANFPYLSLSFELPQVGDKVYTIGSPEGLENTVSEGIVSGIRKINGITYIQHTANTDHGSSGGVLLNEYGQVIGITSAGYDGTSLDFAIPTSYLQGDIIKK